MLGNIDFAASAVAGYLGHEIYYPQANRFGSFVIWDDKRNRTDRREVNDVLKRLLAESPEGILMILNQPLGATTHLVKVAEFTGSIVPNENFYLYRTQR